MEEINQHQTRIVKLIHDILLEINQLSLSRFNHNQALKEKVLLQLQLIGQAAGEIEAIVKDQDTAKAEIYSKISALGAAGYHQDTASGADNQVWSILKNELPAYETLIKKDMLQLMEDYDALSNS